MPKTRSFIAAQPPRSHRVAREVAAARLALRRSQRSADHALDVALDRLIEDAARRPRGSALGRALSRVPVVRVLTRACRKRQAIGV